MDAEVRLCYLRVSTWCPFHLQFYCNGHSWLARKLTAEGIDFATADNAFIRVDDFARARKLADGLRPNDLHRLLDALTNLCCPVLETKPLLRLVIGVALDCRFMTTQQTRIHRLYCARSRMRKMETQEALIIYGIQHILNPQIWPHGVYVLGY